MPMLVFRRHRIDRHAADGILDAGFVILFAGVDHEGSHCGMGFWSENLLVVRTINPLIAR